MIYYKAERAVAGLVEKMQANSSTAYITPLEVWRPNNDIMNTGVAWAKDILGDSKASISDDDLFYTKSILVSTNWNKNDDVFDRVEVWSARHTPTHKPTNLEHDEKRLVGHITDVWAIDNEGNVIPDNTPIDDLPNLYHLVNGAVIYTNWQDQEYKDRTAALINEIQGGTKFVSMEALFSNFNYAVVTPEEEFRVVARCEETAFLTKHLRAYGGKGEFDGCKVGRLLRNITFSGKGYVDNPANAPDDDHIGSIIFNNAQVFDFSKATSKNPFKRESGVSYSYATKNNSLNKGLSNMSETLNIDVLQRQNDKLEKTVSDMREKMEQLQAEAAEANVKGLHDRIQALETELAEAKKMMDDEKKKKEDAEKAKSDFEAQLSEANEAKEAAEAKIAQAEAEKVQANRVATLVDGGMDKEAAEAKVELFNELSDDQFEAIAKELVAAIKVQQEGNQTSAPSKGKTGIKVKGSEEGAEASDDETKDDDDDPSNDPAEANADDSVVNDAEASDDPALATKASAEEDEVAQTQAELRQALAHYLPHTGADYTENEESANDDAE